METHSHVKIQNEPMIFKKCDGDKQSITQTVGTLND